MMQEFIDNIKKIIGQHGYPLKKVSLPLGRMNQVSDEKGLIFSEVLEKLKEEGVDSLEQGGKIIFFPVTPVNQEEMMKKAQEIINNMTPGERDELMKAYQQMTPEEREKIMKMSGMGGGS